MTMTYLTLRLERRGPAAWVWMNRPEVHNAFDETLIADLTAAFAAVDADRDVRAIVLAGEGKSFSAGADLNWMRRQGTRPPPSCRQNGFRRWPIMRKS
jgi:methylglutaconyl-CoA hydratase